MFRNLGIWPAVLCFVLAYLGLEAEQSSCGLASGQVDDQFAVRTAAGSRQCVVGTRQR